MNLLLLGYGFTSFYLKKELDKLNYNIIVSTRSKNNNKYLTDKDNFIIFDLLDLSTYKNIPNNTNIILTFSAEPFDNIKILLEILKEKNSKILLVLGTTSSYINKEGIIYEESELNLLSERVKSEILLKKNGANILRLAGIWGEERNPFNWLQKGLIKNSNKTINLIHIKDIVNVIVFLIKSNISSEVFNLSDGQEYFWKDIWKYAFENKIVNTPCPPSDNREVRIIENKKIYSLLGNNYKFKTIYEEKI
ncbi:MAG: hypothetical protein U0457_07945 [Candidatus Sericytochromatia bacterium]